MKIGIILPLRSSASGGFIKHLECVIAHWPCDDSIDVVYPENTVRTENLSRARCISVSADDYKKSFKELSGRIFSGQYDVCLVTPPRKLRVGLTPVLMIPQNAEPLQSKKYKMPVWWRLRLYMLNREIVGALQDADGIIAISEYMGELLSRVRGLDKKRCELIYHGIEIGQVSSAKVPVDSCVDESPFIFMAGSLVPYRGYEDVLTAIGTNSTLMSSGVRMVIAGGVADGGWYKKRLMGLLLKYNLLSRVTFLGEISHSEILKYYSKCAAFVQSSRAEACPNIVLESIAHSPIIISCDQPPMPELFRDSALYYGVGQWRELGVLLESVLIDGRRSELRFAERQHLLPTWKDAARKTRQFLFEVAKARGGKHV